MSKMFRNLFNLGKIMGPIGDFGKFLLGLKY